MKNQTTPINAKSLDACAPTAADLEEFRLAVGIIIGKWKIEILWVLLPGPLRFGDPRPIELQDLRHARGEFELVPDREEHEGMLKALRLGAREVREELLHLAVDDQSSLSPFRVLRDVAAGVGPVGAHAPDLCHVEHLPHGREDAVRIRRLLRHPLHQIRDVGARDVGHL